MSLRCGCKDEGDDIIFGPVHECSVDPTVRVERGAQSSWGPMIPAERPYEYVLDELERGGD